MNTNEIAAKVISHADSDKAMLLNALCQVLKESRKRSEQVVTVRLTIEQQQLILNKIMEIIKTI